MVRCGGPYQPAAHIITNEQIDAAWASADQFLMDAEIHQSPLHKATAGGMYEVLTIIGIVECPECGGLGVIEYPPPIGGGCMCPRCAKYTGHGWIREERGDE
jgi:hypothetical protein